MQLGRVTVAVIAPEDLIIAKVLAGRPNDEVDVRGSGDDAVNWGIGNGLARALRDIFGVTLNTNTSSDWGMDYR